MPVQVSYPGVYIDEQLSGAHTITRVSTSVTAFVGRARRGRLGTPTRVTNLAQFQALYGNDASMGELVPQVGQFFLNGGSTAWIMRIANGAAAAAVTLNNEAGQAVLTLTANDAGEDGNLLRAEVDYDTSNPESTFNLTVYRRIVGPTGTVTQAGLETFNDLSMNSKSGRSVETVVNSASLLVSAQINAGVVDPMVHNVPGVSISGLMFPPADPDVFTAIEQRFGTNQANTRSIMISVDGQPAIPVTFAQGADLAGFINNMQTAINTALPSQGMTGAVAVEMTPAADGIRQLKVTSNGGSVVISSAQQSDVAAALQLGVANGGIEISRWSRAHPAPTGIVARLHVNADDLGRLHAFAISLQNEIGAWRLTDPALANPHTQDAFPGAPAQQMYVGTNFVPPGGDKVVGSLLNVRQHLEVLAASVAGNTKLPNSTVDRFSASLQGLRLAVVPKFEGSDAGANLLLSSAGARNISAGGELFEAAGGGFSGSLQRSRLHDRPNRRRARRRAVSGKLGRRHQWRAPGPSKLHRRLSGDRPRHLQPDGAAARARSIRCRSHADLGAGERVLPAAPRLPDRRSAVGQ
jgi:uncharacterized protein